MLGTLPNLLLFARAVFCTPLTTIFIEGQFSRRNYLKDKKRASMHDATASDILHCQSVTDVLENVFPFTATFEIDTTSCFAHDLIF